VDADYARHHLASLDDPTTTCFRCRIAAEG
jgi:hypothetical protein